MFGLSKIVGALLTPSNLLFILLVVGAILIFTPWRRFGRWVVGVAAVLFVAVVVTPLPEIGLRWLEERFPVPTELPERIDGIVVLGGDLDVAVSDSRSDEGAIIASDRSVALIILARRFPEARLVFTGGTGSLVSDAIEADRAEILFRDLGLPDGRVVFERRSRTTRENAMLAKELVDPGPDEAWLLVTSASHIPRSVGTFRQAGWPVIAYPVGFKTRSKAGARFTFDVGRGLLLSDILAHEILGLVYYRIAGFTDALVPGP